MAFPTAGTDSADAVDDTLDALRKFGVIMTISGDHKHVAMKMKNIVRFYGRGESVLSLFCGYTQGTTGVL